MCKFDVSLLLFFALIITSLRCQSNEEDRPPIPELNDFDEAYHMLEYAKNTLNPLAARLPMISTTNKEIAEYLMLKVGVNKWKRTILGPNRGALEEHPCVVRRVFKTAGMKHDLFREKNIKIKKGLGTFETHTINFQYNFHANKRTIETLKCPCMFQSKSDLYSEFNKPKSIDKDELKLIESTGKKVKLRIIPTTIIVPSDPHTAPNKSSPSYNIDEYPYESSEEDSERAKMYRLADKASARRVPGRDICINGHVLLGKGINGENSYYIFARDRGFLRVVAHLIFT